MLSLEAPEKNIKSETQHEQRESIVSTFDFRQTTIKREFFMSEDGEEEQAILSPAVALMEESPVIILPAARECEYTIKEYETPIQVVALEPVKKVRKAKVSPTIKAVKKIPAKAKASAIAPAKPVKKTRKTIAPRVSKKKATPPEAMGFGF